MDGAVQISLTSFVLVYLLLIVVTVVMKMSKISQTKLLFVASLRMTVQLVIAGFVLEYLFDNPSPILVALFLVCMVAFAIHRILNVNEGLNRRFKVAIGVSLAATSLAVIAFFVVTIIGESIFNPQYMIPISGMILGNAMTGVSLGVKTFMAQYEDSKEKLNALLNLGATPKNILHPLVNKALETALLPTINSLLGMGIVMLPGMMTGQILSGESPTTAILYQICVMICITTVVCLAVFLSLNLGYKTLFNKESQFIDSKGEY